MTDPHLLDLIAQGAEIQSRAYRLPIEQSIAQKLLTDRLEAGASREDVEEARLQCSALFEAQLDLLVEATEHKRKMDREIDNG